MVKVILSRTYNINQTNEIELPEGYSPEDIADVWVKWDGYTLEFKDGESQTDRFEWKDSDSYDWKNPMDVEVFDEDNGPLGFSEWS